MLLCGIGYWVSQSRDKTPLGSTFKNLKIINEIHFHNLDTHFKCHVEKFSRLRRWKVCWEDDKWVVNEQELGAIYSRLAEIFDRKIAQLEDPYYEITVVSKKMSKNVKLSKDEACYVFFGDKSSQERDTDKLFLKKLLSERIFSYVRGDCKIFKLKIGENEYVFVNRYNRWFLENFGENIELSNESVTRFFHLKLSRFRSMVFQRSLLCHYTAIIVASV